MSDTAPQLPPLPDAQEEEQEIPVVQQAHIAAQAYAPAAPVDKKRVSLTMLPQRLESASHISLIFLMLAIFGFGCGVAVMILLLN